MNLILLFLLGLGSAWGAGSLIKREHCFLSQKAFEDSRDTLEVLLKHRTQTDPDKALLMHKGEAYKVIWNPDLSLCFTFYAYSTDMDRLDKEVARFRLEEKESKIYISDRLKTRPVRIKLTESGTLGVSKQLWQLNQHLDLVYDPLQNKEIKLRFAKHFFSTGPHHRPEELLRNRILSDDILNIRAFYLHERLIRFEFRLNSGKNISVMRGSGHDIGLKFIMQWLLNDSSLVYSYYPVELFNLIDGKMLYQGEIETLPH